MTAVHPPENPFEGVRPSPYEETLRDVPEHAEAVARRIATMTPQDVEAGQRERTARMVRLAELMAAGLPADAPSVQAETDARYRALTELRAVSIEEYRALGRSCVDDEQWRAAYEAIAPGLAAYQRDAVEAYAAAGLG